MADHLSFALLEMGVNACKLFPFGPIHEVMPYMTRRMQENQGFMGSTALERYISFSSSLPSPPPPLLTLLPSKLLMSEIKRRTLGK